MDCRGARFDAKADSGVKADSTSPGKAGGFASAKGGAGGFAALATSSASLCRKAFATNAESLDM